MTCVLAPVLYGAARRCEVPGLPNWPGCTPTPSSQESDTFTNTTQSFSSSFPSNFTYCVQYVGI